MEADFGKIWKLEPDLEKNNVSCKPILKILIELATFFKKLESWYKTLEVGRDVGSVKWT